MFLQNVDPSLPQDMNQPNMVTIHEAGLTADTLMTERLHMTRTGEDLMIPNTMLIKQRKATINMHLMRDT